MNHNTIDDLRNRLFATLDALQDKENPLDIERAMAMKDVAQVIVNATKVEIDHMKVTGSAGSGFIPENREAPSLPAAAGNPVSLAAQISAATTGSGSKRVTQLGGGTVTQHRMR